jgi:hypothetical protein
VLLTILEVLGSPKEEDPHPTLSRKRERGRADAAATPSPACGRRLG